MKIPDKLEEMVADLISDERKKREEIEAVLAKVHELVEAYERGEVDLPMAELVDAPWPEPSSEPVQELSDAQRVANFTKAFERRGMPPERAKEAAEEECGLRDGRM